MNSENIEEKVAHAVREIGLALNASHNTVTTDDPDTEPNKESWRVDHKTALEALAYLESQLTSTDICPVCGNRSIDL